MVSKVPKPPVAISVQGDFPRIIRILPYGLKSARYPPDALPDAVAKAINPMSVFPGNQLADKSNDISMTLPAAAVTRTSAVCSTA